MLVAARVPASASAACPRARGGVGRPPGGRAVRPIPRRAGDVAPSRGGASSSSSSSSSAAYQHNVSAAASDAPPTTTSAPPASSSSSSSSSPSARRASAPARGPGSAPAALQEARGVSEVLDAAELLVLPGEETAHWHGAPIHRDKRRVAARRALARLARWLAALESERERARCVADPRFARLARCAAGVAANDRRFASSGGDDDDGDEEDDENADEDDDYEKHADDDAADALRALASLAPLPKTLLPAFVVLAERALNLPKTYTRGRGRAMSTGGGGGGGFDTAVLGVDTAVLLGVPPHVATVAAWACDRVAEEEQEHEEEARDADDETTTIDAADSASDSADSASDSSSAAAASKALAAAASVARAALDARRVPFRVLPDLARAGDPHDSSSSSSSEGSGSGFFSSRSRSAAGSSDGWEDAAAILAAAAASNDEEEEDARFFSSSSSSSSSSAASASASARYSRLASALRTTDALAAEVPFRRDRLTTRDGTVVDERRETCWMADPGVAGLAYSGKVMSPVPFTPLVDDLRAWIRERTGLRFDCALLNLYPTPEAACKYHRDPDLGRLWARDSVIVSVGETRRFAFRKVLSEGGNNGGKGKERSEEHWFRLRGLDCVWMFADCNDAWEHCVMRAEGVGDDAPRASVVFKRSLPPTKKGGLRGHAVVVEGKGHQKGGKGTKRGGGEKGYPRGGGGGEERRTKGGSRGGRGGGRRGGGGRGGRGGRGGSGARGARV